MRAQSESNALHPNINIYELILYTVLDTTPKVLTERICVSRASLFGDHFLYSCNLNV